MSRISLKGFIPSLARELQVTPAALYERQRALVRSGLLQSDGGRGPGRGLAASPKSVSLLLSSLLAQDGLSGAEKHTKALANLKSVDSGGCPLTGQKTFARAFAEVLANEEIAKQVPRVTVDRSDKGPVEAVIAYEEPGSEQPELYPSLRGYPRSRFGPGRKSSVLRLGIDQSATLSGDFAALARSLKEISK